MSETAKGVYTCLCIVGIFVAALTWTIEKPDWKTWVMFGIGCLTAVGGFVAAARLMLRKDLETNHLSRISPVFFNRDGFCFAFKTSAQSGIAYIEIYFQSQFEKASVGRIALRPARGFFMTRARIDGIGVEIECPPAGFGHVRIPVPVPEKFQGKVQAFEVGAETLYPSGRGRRLRFQPGVFLRANTRFGDKFGKALMFGSFLTGSIYLAKPVTVKLAIPALVTDSIEALPEMEYRILEQLPSG